MATYRKTKFFRDVDKIFVVPILTREKALDVFDELIASTPHFASIHAYVEESQRDDGVDEGSNHDVNHSEPLDHCSPRTQTLLLPTTQTQIVDDMVPETTRESSPVIKISTATKTSSDMMEIVPETRTSEDLPPSIPISLAPSLVETPSIPHVDDASNSSIDMSLNESSIVPSISFHVDDSRDFGGDTSSIHVNDSLAAFPAVSATPHFDDEISTPPTQKSSAPPPHLHSSTTTMLVAQCASAPSAVPIEYYDTDHFAEIMPCWLAGPPCRFHDPHLRHPELLFYVQALDMFLHTTPSTGPTYLRTACVVARRVFVGFWHRHLNASTDSTVSFELDHYLSRGNTLPGVCTPVWRYLQAQWHAHHASVLHSSTFYSASPQDPNQSAVSALGHVRHALAAMQVYGRQHGLESLNALIPHYLHAKEEDQEAFRHRHVVSADEMHVALRGLQSKLKCPVFSMGTFRRGGLYLSVLDVLAVTTASVGSIVDLLRRVKVLECDTVHVTAARVIAPIRFKSHQLLLDLKVYPQPIASFAMLYFTGPATYVASTVLAGAMADYGTAATFDDWYTWVLSKYGADHVHAHVTDEASACRVLHIPFKAPKDRLF